MRQVSPAASVPASMTRYLLPYERSCIAVRKHPAELAGPLILVFGGLVAAGELTRRSVRPKIVWGAYLSALPYLLQQVAAWRATYFAVTDMRMILVSGFTVRKVAMMPLARVTDMSFQRSALGRLLGYGKFIIESAGKEQALRTIDFLPHPEQLYLQVCGLVFPDAVAETQQDQDDLPDSHC
jgi:uncharacterized membrane protein YdbT with pleckstrin-like domain